MTTTNSTKKGNRGIYTPKPVSVTFPSTFPNEKFAGKTMTYAGRGRKPAWWALAEDVGLIAPKEVKTVDAVVDATPADQASGPQG